METLVHEMGHIFGMADYDAEHPADGHPSHLNLASSDGCVMVYGSPTASHNDTWYLPALFGGPTAPPGEPDDCRQKIASQTDPLPTTP